MANELLVQFKSGTPAAAQAAALAAIGREVVERIPAPALRGDGSAEGLLRVKTPLAAREALGRLHGRGIEYAELNVLYKAQGATAGTGYLRAGSYPYYVAYDSYYVNTDNNTYVSSGQWGLYGAASPNPNNRNPYGSGADVAWANGHIGSSSVAVGVVDTGIQADHPDLAGQVRNPAATATPSPTYPNDVYGWNFLGDNNDVSDYGAKPYSRDHGTYMAGIIGAKPDINPATTATSAVGMNWNITLIAAKFMDANGGTTANAVKAITYLVDLKTTRGVNVVAINCSWGSTLRSDALLAAIQKANAANILVVASAGNGSTAGAPVNDDVTPFYPACYDAPNVISVAAINPAGALYQSSNYGATSVDVGAPGARIWTTVAGSSWYSYSGTSVATAFVTGAAALYAASNPAAPVDLIKGAILSQTIQVSAPSGKCVTGGSVNASNF